MHDVICHPVARASLASALRALAARWDARPAVPTHDAIEVQGGDGRRYEVRVEVREIEGEERADGP